LVGRFSALWLLNHSFLIALFFDLSAFGGFVFSPPFFAPQAGAVLFFCGGWSACIVGGLVGLLLDVLRLIFGSFLFLFGFGLLGLFPCFICSFLVLFWAFFGSVFRLSFLVCFSVFRGCFCGGF
jgi:hypothetical protein